MGNKSLALISLGCLEHQDSLENQARQADNSDIGDNLNPSRLCKG